MLGGFARSERIAADQLDRGAGALERHRRQLRYVVGGLSLGIAAGFLDREIQDCRNGRVRRLRHGPSVAWLAGQSDSGATGATSNRNPVFLEAFGSTTAPNIDRDFNVAKH